MAVASSQLRVAPSTSVPLFPRVTARSLHDSPLSKGAQERERHKKNLQRVLHDLQHENEARCGQLLEASRRIEAIGVELRQAETTRGKLRKEAKNVLQAEKGLQERLQGQLSGGAELRRLLAASQAGHQKQLQSLASSEHESKVYWDKLTARDAELERFTEQMEEEVETQLLLRDLWSRAEASERKLSREYRQAEAAAATRRCEIREARNQTEEHTVQASGHEAEEQQLLDQLDKVESTKNTLSRRLSTLDGATLNSESLRTAVSGSLFHMEQLRATLEILEPNLGNLQEEFARTRQHKQDQEKSFSSELAALQALRCELQVVDAHNNELVEDIDSTREASCKLRATLTSSEQEAEQLESRLRSDLDRCTNESDELETRGELLERDLRKQSYALKKMEAKKQEMLEIVAERESEKVELTETKQQIERDYHVEKERCRCVVS